jgi:hypothetical protein
MIEIAFPYDLSERLAWLTAMATILAGLAFMILPQRISHLVGLAIRPDSKNGLSELRGPFGGMMVGLGVSCILLAQPFTYIALGLAFGFAVIGRLISFVVDRTFNEHCVVVTILELLAAYFPLRFAFEALVMV